MNLADLEMTGNRVTQAHLVTLGHAAKLVCKELLAKRFDHYSKA